MTEEQKLESLKIRMEVFKSYQTIANTPISINWMVKNILGMDNKSQLRLYKIRNILENGR
jgi:hypothetical protein